MTITFVIPTFNAEEYLERCLRSIRNQTLPVEIIIVDGGSTDRTWEIADKYDCLWLANPLKLAEFGLKQGILATNTDLVVVFAADNELTSKKWAELVVSSFAHYPGLCALWGKLVSGDNDPPINKYFALVQSDPLNWFINKNLGEYLKKMEVISVDPKKPLCWGANGIVFKTDKIKPVWDREGYLGDNDAFQTMVEQGNNVVTYYDIPFVYHHHIKSLGHWVKKWQRNMRQHQHATRNMRWIVPDFKFKLVLWFLYLPFCWIDAFYRAIKDGNVYWLYHPACCWAQTTVYITEVIRKCLRKNFIR